MSHVVFSTNNYSDPRWLFKRFHAIHLAYNMPKNLNARYAIGYEILIEQNVLTRVSYRQSVFSVFNLILRNQETSSNVRKRVECTYSYLDDQCTFETSKAL